MNTSQIQCCIDCNPLLKKSILGVYAADQLPVNLKFPCGFIANTDKHSKEGVHWCSFYFPNSTTVEYFDSYGKSVNYFNDYFPIYVSKFPSIVTNSKQLQSLYSDVCGMYCMFFLLQRLNGLSFHEIVNSFSNVHECNDSFVYNYVSNVFVECIQNTCFYNQICKPIIKRVLMY